MQKVAAHFQTEAMMVEWYQGDDRFSYPLPPEEAAQKIVDMLLPDLPEARQIAVCAAIKEWASAREDAVIGTTLESQESVGY